MRLLKNRIALSTVVTTLILLVVSVLLATVVTFYAINVTTTRVQEESLYLTKQHIWYNTSGWAQAACVLLNTGGKDCVIDKLSVRGQECQWSNTYFWKTTTVTVSKDLNVTNHQLAGDTETINIQNGSRSFTRATNDLTLRSGWTIVIYVMNPDSIALNDVGITCGITLFTANAQYYKEANVEAAQ